MRPAPRHRCRLAVWTGLVLAAAAVLGMAGDGALATPSLLSPGRWPAWFGATDPVVASFAVARIASLALAWYLLAVTVAGVALPADRANRLAVLIDRLTVPTVRRLLATSVSMSLAGGLGANAALTAPRALAQPASPPPTVLAPPVPAPATLALPVPAPAITMHRLPDDAAPPGPEVVPPSAATPAPAPAPDEPEVPLTWQVEAGQCLWSISEAVLARAWGQAPSDDEIVPHWLRLIEANRQALADPDNPDLIYPGQVFSVPPPGRAAPRLAPTS